MADTTFQLDPSISTSEKTTSALPSTVNSSTGSFSTPSSTTPSTPPTPSTVPTATPLTPQQQANNTAIAQGGFKPTDVLGATTSTPTPPVSSPQTPAIPATPTPANTQTTTTTPTTSTTTTPAPGSSADILKQENDANSTYQQQLNNFESTYNGIMSGSVPLTAYEQSQLDATRASFQSVINQQQVINANMIGGTQVTQETQGLSRYSPQIAIGNIFAAQTAANQKITDLNTQMNQALSTMETGFRKDDMKSVKDAFDELTQAKNDKVAQLDKLYNVAKTNEAQVKTDAQNAVMANVASTLINPALSQEDKKKKVADLIASGNLTADQIKQAQSDLNDQNQKYIDNQVSVAGQYETYKNAQIASGKTPMSAGDFISAQKAADAMATAKANNAFDYQKAFDAEAGKNAADNASGGNNKVQQGLEKQYATTLKTQLTNRSGGLGLQDQKVNQAIHLQALYNSYATKNADGTTTYNIPTSQYAELVMGLANLISPTGSSEADRAELMSKTAAGDIKGALQYIIGTPQNGNTQQVIQNLVDSIERQGAVAEQIRDQDVAVLHGLAPTDLDPDRVAALDKTVLSSFTNPQQNIAQVQQNAVNSIAQFHDVSPANAAIIDQIHAQYPNASATDIAQKLGLI